MSFKHIALLAIVVISCTHAAKVKYTQSKDVIEFTLEDSKAAVAFLRIKGTDIDEYFPFNKNKHLNVHLSRTQIPSGKYKLSAILNDPHSEVDVGDITIENELRADTKKAMELSEGRLWTKRPEFLHQFKPPAPRAPPIVALVFTAALAVPWLYLLFVGIPKSHSSFSFGLMATNLPFFAVLGFVLFVLFTYWMNGTIFPTIGAVTVGCCVLSSLIFSRKDKSKSE